MQLSLSYGTESYLRGVSVTGDEHQIPLGCKTLMECLSHLKGRRLFYCPEDSKKEVEDTSLCDCFHQTCGRDTFSPERQVKL